MMQDPTIPTVECHETKQSHRKCPDIGNAAYLGLAATHTHIFVCVSVCMYVSFLDFLGLSSACFFVGFHKDLRIGNESVDSHLQSSSHTSPREPCFFLVVYVFWIAYLIWISIYVWFQVQVCFVIARCNLRIAFCKVVVIVDHHLFCLDNLLLIKFQLLLSQCSSKHSNLAIILVFLKSIMCFVDVVLEKN